MVPPWFAAPLRGTALAAAPAMGRLQPGAITGAPVASLRLLPFARAAPEPSSASCTLPVSTRRALCKGQCRKRTLSFSADLEYAIMIASRAAVVKPFLRKRAKTAVSIEPPEYP